MIEQIQTLIEQNIETQELKVDGDGSHFQVIVVSNAFAGLNAVKKQQMVYAAINDKIRDGSMHAIDSMQLYTKAQWAEQQAG